MKIRGQHFKFELTRVDQDFPDGFGGAVKWKGWELTVRHDSEKEALVLTHSRQGWWNIPSMFFVCYRLARTYAQEVYP